MAGMRHELIEQQYLELELELELKAGAPGAPTTPEGLGLFFPGVHDAY